MKQKRFIYKGWGIIWNSDTGYYDLFTPAEMSQPLGLRYAESESSTIDQAKVFIDNY